MLCPCGSHQPFAECCEPLLLGKKQAENPAELMRSRYVAYVTQNEPYLFETLAPASRQDYDRENVINWSKQSEWLGLTIIKSEKNQVEFAARYKMQGRLFEHHEVSEFKLIDGRWYFVEGDGHTHEDGKTHEESLQPKQPAQSNKVARNSPCPCGSGLKYKKCCGK